ncbi:MAG: hypothetical protein DRP10_00185 [Candidatus Aenigmatarchaeota archaeon]|nr:MAG: hypothetical protein DRP10_00185 [Candidatus Aenigmarchaeota archaeon]
MREADFLEALVCGFLVALTAALFVEYFGIADFGPQMFGIFIGGLALINFAILFLIAWPFRFSGMFVFFVIVMVLGYAAYGPYATYLRGPMSQISESLSGMPEMAEKQIHCLVLIFTNPMAYQRECVLTEQPPAPEEKPENFGLEITEFQMQPRTEIYAGMPIQIWMTLENKGDYDAKNVEINTSGGKYEVCENLEVLNIKSINGDHSDKIRKETNHYFSLTGRINDPWDEKVKCTYAKNKMVIGGTIKTTYSYDYETESYLDIEVIKNVNETIPKFRVESAKEKAAPANILMYTFLPLIWEGAGEGFREGIIPISLKNERRKGTIVFRGKYEYKWFEGTLESIKNEMQDWTPLGDYKYQYCVNKTNTSQKLDKCEKEEEGKNITININNESACVECGGEPIYRRKGKRERNGTEYDKIIIKPIGDVGNYIELSCNKKLSEEGKISSCSCVNNVCEIKYAGEKNDLKIKPGDDELLYTGLTLSLKKGLWKKEDPKLTFGIKAHATYRVEMEKSESLQIKNPHYTD